MHQRDAVKCQVPCREPGVLPGVRHGHHVECVKAAPAGVAAVSPLGRRWRLGRVAVEPPGHVVVVELLAPQHPGERLTHHSTFVGRRRGRGELGVELVRLGAPLGHHPGEVGSERGRRVTSSARRPQAQPQLGGLAGAHRDPVPHRTLAAPSLRVDGVGPADDVVVDAVLRPPRGRRSTVEPPEVGVVVAEQQLPIPAVRRRPGQQLKLAEEGMLDGHRRAGGRGQRRRGHPDIPGPGVAVPQGGKDVQEFGVRPGIGHADRHQDVRRVGLGVVHVDDPVAVIDEDSGVEQLVLGVELAAPPVLVQQLLVRERPLRVVVAPAVPGVAGQRVEVPPVLLDVLAVIRLGPGQPEHALLEDRVAPVPQRERQTQPLFDVAEAGQPVLAPAVGAGACVVMRQVAPGAAVGTVVLANRAPLPFAQVGPPQIPVAGLPQALVEPAEAIDPLSLRGTRHPEPPRVGC